MKLNGVFLPLASLEMCLLSLCAGSISGCGGDDENGGSLDSRLAQALVDRRTTVSVPGFISSTKALYDLCPSGDFAYEAHNVNNVGTRDNFDRNIIYTAAEFRASGTWSVTDSTFTLALPDEEAVEHPLEDVLSGEWTTGGGSRYRVYWGESRCFVGSQTAPSDPGDPIDPDDPSDPGGPSDPDDPGDPGGGS